MVDAYIFVPLYNVKINSNILDKSINGFKIIDANTYYKEYRTLLNTQNNNSCTYELDKVLNKSNIASLSPKPVCNYLIVKKISHPRIVSQTTVDFTNFLIGKNLNKIDCFIRASRFLYQGNIQINQYFVLSKISKEIYTLPVSSDNKCILGDYWSENYHYLLPEYKLDVNIISEIIKFTKKLIRCKKQMLIPVSFFTDYYMTTGLIERMIKLAIVWETSILNDCKSELKYRLQTRTSALLNQNLSTVLSLAYDIRSSLVHSGTITKSELKNMRKLISIAPDETDNMACLFIFMRDFLENITRKILQIFVDDICKTRKTIEQVAKEIDDSIFCSFEKINTDTQRD